MNYHLMHTLYLYYGHNLLLLFLLSPMLYRVGEKEIWSLFVYLFATRLPLAQQAQLRLCFFQ